MSEYSPQEQAAYDFGFKLGKSTCAEQLAAEREALATVRELREHDQKALAAERDRCESFKNLCLGVERQLAAAQCKMLACDYCSLTNPDTTALDAAIAERITTRVLRLREEEVQPLVDALYDIAENDTYTGSERIYVAKQALAKVKAKP